ncbi:MAG: DUF3750 domain-containing protein [Alphaproteobacteria bacterium]|nr:DUF3750 domain-containing protein [Alphaproteobacteria bacterium]
MTRVGWAALLVLVALATACRPRVLYPDVGVARPTEPVVHLRRADVVWPIGEHYFFVYFDPAGDGAWHRIELFAGVREGKRVLRDRFEPDASFDARWLRPARLVREYRGARAERLIDVLEPSPDTYPRQDRYVLSGPNSNSYAMWVMRQARVGHDFTERAVGRRVPSWVGLSDSRTGLALHTPVLGIELGLADGIEIDVGPSTWGIDLVPPAIKTPFGRLGVPQPSLRLGEPAPQRRKTIVAAEEAVLTGLGVDRHAMAAKFPSKRRFRKWLRYSARMRLRGRDAPPPSTVE